MVVNYAPGILANHELDTTLERALFPAGEAYRYGDQRALASLERGLGKGIPHNHHFPAGPTFTGRMALKHQKANSDRVKGRRPQDASLREAVQGSRMDLKKIDFSSDKKERLGVNQGVIHETD